jgi:hypothetical protein
VPVLTPTANFNLAMDPSISGTFIQVSVYIIGKYYGTMPSSERTIAKEKHQSSMLVTHCFLCRIIKKGVWNLFYPTFNLPLFLCGSLQPALWTNDLSLLTLEITYF